jgi:hypothetical protein
LPEILIMKLSLSIVAALFTFGAANAQIITITNSDMPVAGDKLGYSNATLAGLTISPGDSGMNRVWDYTLSAASQSVDTYKTAADVNAAYANTISNIAYGYKVADSIPGLSTIAMIPISIDNIYTFFQKISSPRAAFIASAYAFSLNNIVPEAANYTDPDVWYFFPLTYGNPTDSAHFALSISFLGQYGIKMSGYRQTRVDGYGTILTPYYTLPVRCIRVRSVSVETDSVTFSGSTYGIPRTTVEYKWLVNGSHYPALWVTSTLIAGNETITSAKYRDTVLPQLAVASEKPAIYTISAFPNPAVSGRVTLDIPADWKAFTTEVYDITGKLQTVINNQREINLQTLAAGQYIIRVTSGAKIAYVKVTK